MTYRRANAHTELDQQLSAQEQPTSSSDATSNSGPNINLLHQLLLLCHFVLERDQHVTVFHKPIKHSQPNLSRCLVRQQGCHVFQQEAQ